MKKRFCFFIAILTMCFVSFATNKMFSENLSDGFDLNLHPNFTEKTDMALGETYLNQMNSIRSFILLKNKKITPSEAEKITSYLIKYSYKYNVEPELTASLIFKESRFNPNAVSPNGARGLGQLMPHTCKSMGLDDCFEIEGNIKGTVRYIKYLLDLWKGYEKQVELALASYLLGPNKVKLYNNVINSGRANRFINDILFFVEFIKESTTSKIK